MSPLAPHLIVKSLANSYDPQETNLLVKNYPSLSPGDTQHAFSEVESS